MADFASSSAFRVAVTDASGTWGQSNPMGTHGFPALGDCPARERVAYGLPDLPQAGGSMDIAGPAPGQAPAVGSGCCALDASAKSAGMAGCGCAFSVLPAAGPTVATRHSCCA